MLPVRPATVMFDGYELAVPIARASGKFIVAVLLKTTAHAGATNVKIRKTERLLASNLFVAVLLLECSVFRISLSLKFSNW